LKNKKLFAILTLVCFMMTLMPVAAFAAADTDTSYIYTVKSNPTVKLKETTTPGQYEVFVPVALEIADEFGAPATTGSVAVWFTEAGKTTAATAFKGLYTWNTTTEDYDPVTGFNDTTDVATAALANGTTYYAKFVREGQFTVNASFAPETILADSKLLGTDANHKVVTVKGIVNNEYVISFDNTDDDTPNATPIVDGTKVIYGWGSIAADNVATTTVTMNLSQNDNTAAAPVAGANVKGATVSITTNSSNIEVSKEKVTTNALGNFSFDITGIREGNYEIYISYGSYEVTLEVTVGSTAPAYISVAKSPTAPIDIDTTGNLANVVRFLITDINGNVVPASSIAPTVSAANVINPTLPAGAIKAATGANDGAYAAIVDAPADSDLSNEDVYLVVDNHASNAADVYTTLAVVGGFDAEGTYKFKVALDNGNAVYVTVEVAEFGTPVGIVLEYAAPAVELGGTLAPKDFLLVDAKGVTTSAEAKGVELAASGYAIDNFDTANGTITVKADEKYLGSTINVTAVSERYNLMTSTSVKVVAEAAGLMFATKTAEVNVNNAINVVLVDAMGNRAAFGNGANINSIDYVVLAKPEGAKVSVNTAAADQNLATAGSFKMNLTCDKVGTVKVQAIAKVLVTPYTPGAAQVTKYYTGVGEIAVGNGQVGKSVVMSIGSNQVIADGKVATVDAKPMVQNNRTFVPFRALAEAFGATVAYDQATSSVTAELNGVKVVMTVGSPVYTVNGVEKTADVAPFVSDSRTFVPVRFAAEAFGIKVVPTYNEDGSVADVLFNM